MIKALEDGEAGGPWDRRLPSDETHCRLEEEVVERDTPKVLLRHEAFPTLLAHGFRLETLAVHESVVDLSQPDKKIASVELLEGVKALIKRGLNPFLNGAEIRAIAGKATWDCKFSVSKAASVELVHGAIPKVELPQQPLRKDVFDRSLAGSFGDVVSA
ncbi:hypothetical protein [Arthrobacter sp. MDT1-65]